MLVCQQSEMSHTCGTSIFVRYKRLVTVLLSCYNDNRRQYVQKLSIFSFAGEVNGDGK